jgi:hypothetical protein
MARIEMAARTRRTAVSRRLGTAAVSLPQRVTDEVTKGPLNGTPLWMVTLLDATTDTGVHTAGNRTTA